MVSGVGFQVSEIRSQMPEDRFQRTDKRISRYDRKKLMNIEHLITPSCETSNIEYCILAI